MKYDPKIHHRRSIRLRGHDYTQAGEYYVTLCVKDRECLLGEILRDHVKLSRIGEIAKECWEEIPKHFPNAALDEYVIMPNHVHGIIILGNPVGTRHAVSQRDTAPQLHAVSQRERFGKPVPGSLSTIMRSFKSAASKGIHSKGYSAFAWQSRFYEHVIRNAKDLDRIRNYILDNPCTWSKDENFSANIHGGRVQKGMQDYFDLR